MDFSHFLNTSLPLEERLLSFGFQRQADLWHLERKLDKDFYARILITEGKITVDAIEEETGEKYILLDVKSAQGGFVGGLREKVSKLMEEIRTECFVTNDLTEAYISWIKESLGIEGEFPWEDNDAEVLRCPNGKWLGLIMYIPFQKLGIDSEEKVHVVNLKAEDIPSLVDKKSIFPAWHMNKKYWITVLLTTVTDFEKLKTLTLRSYQLVIGKK